MQNAFLNRLLGFRFHGTLECKYLCSKFSAVPEVTTLKFCDLNSEFLYVLVIWIHLAFVGLITRRFSLQHIKENYAVIFHKVKFIRINTWCCNADTSLSRWFYEYLWIKLYSILFCLENFIFAWTNCCYRLTGTNNFLFFFKFF